MKGDREQTFAAAVDAIRMPTASQEEPQDPESPWRLYRLRTVPIVPLELSRGGDGWEPIEAPRVDQIFRELRQRYLVEPVDGWIARLEDGQTVQVGPFLWLRARAIEPPPTFTR